ncbi:hypothetical protein [Embleya sp. NPDC020886]|uniref:hypothetical protein n=1 Tax=Embleya sp. NPDC020886 TaxID=3363980 RepID=UPI0037978377
MGVGTTYLTKARLRELLGVNTFGLRRVLRREDFPASTKDRPSLRSRFEEDDDPVWNATEVYRWAAHDRDFGHRGAVLLRTDPENPAPGRWAGAHGTAQGPATDRHTDIGTIRLVHTATLGRRPPPRPRPSSSNRCRKPHRSWQRTSARTTRQA